jgi:hypothetical protein
MHSFENRLWSDLMDAYRPDLAIVEHADQRRRRALLPITAAVLTAVVAAVAMVLSLSANSLPAAYAVSQNADGTVTVMIRQLAGISGANEQLAKLGVRARATTYAPYTPGCKVVRVRDGALMKMVHPSKPFAMTIDPSLIPQDTTLLISARLMTIRHTPLTRGKDLLAADIGTSLLRDPVPACALHR